MLKKIKQSLRSNDLKQSLRSNDLKYFLFEIIIFLFVFINRFYNLGYPPTYYFDEVYHAFTAEQMYKGNPAAWEWWNANPPGFAYEWTHPPLAKEFMWFAMSIFGDHPFAWRFFSALFGSGIIVLIYLIAKHLFNRKVALLSSAVASLSGLLLVMSRIAMNDSYFLFFSLLAVLMFLKDRKLLMGIFLGLSLASKWTASFTLLIIGAIYIVKNFNNLLNIKLLKFIFCLIIIPMIIYLISYTPFFMVRHSPPGLNYSNFQTFIELQQQMWWYHTGLKATHTYQSTPIQWVLDLRPVWLYVNYSTNPIPSSPSVYQSTPRPSLYSVHLGDTLWGIAQNKLGSGFRWKELRGYQGVPEELPIGTQIEIPIEVNKNPITISPSPNITKENNSIASIFTLDNPLIPWFGLVSIIFLIFQLFNKFSIPVFFVVLSYFLYFIFWIKSPRIMFNYHYLPSTAFLTIAIGFVLNELVKDKRGKYLVGVFFVALIISFIYFFPIWRGVHLDTSSYNSRFWISTWK